MLLQLVVFAIGLVLITLGQLYIRRFIWATLLTTLVTPLICLALLIFMVNPLYTWTLLALPIMLVVSLAISLSIGLLVRWRLKKRGSD